MKNETDPDIVNLKALIMLSYGHVIYNCPAKLVAQKLESIVLRFLSPYFSSAKVTLDVDNIVFLSFQHSVQESIVKIALLRTIDLMASVVISNCLSSECKNNFVITMLTHIKVSLFNLPNMKVFMLTSLGVREK